MKDFLIVSRLERLQEHQKIAEKYQVAFEINDFYEPEVLDSPVQLQQMIQAYQQIRIPKGSTMHGAFFDVTVFSQDKRICRISEERMEQSMEIAKELKVRGVVFHTNFNPMISDTGYEVSVIERTIQVLERLLDAYPDIQIYLENMFDTEPKILMEISKSLGRYKNYGVCLDYAHASAYGVSMGYSFMEQWIHGLAPWIRHFHINDNDLKKDLHLAVGDGLIDWGEFFKYYRKYFENCSILIETTQPENQQKSLEYIRRLEGLDWKEENL